MYSKKPNIKVVHAITSILRNSSIKLVLIRKKPTKITGTDERKIFKKKLKFLKNSKISL